MFIKVAGEKKEYPEGLTVKELIEFLYFMGGGAR